MVRALLLLLLLLLMMLLMLLLAVRLLLVLLVLLQAWQLTVLFPNSCLLLNKTRARHAYFARRSPLRWARSATRSGSSHAKASYVVPGVDAGADRFES